MKNINEKIQHTLNLYIEDIQFELKERWNSWEKDLNTPEIYEVVGGILARQITITEHLLSCSSLWNGHMAPMILRSLADNYINLAWILEDPLERSRKFIFFGLGQEKLQIAHQKKELESSGNLEENKVYIEAMENWINSQRYVFLTEVNLSKWSEISVRKMAEEAGCIDFYNYVYQPFSVNAHNMWNHIAKYNLIESSNPLHKNFRRPGKFSTDADFHYVDLACKYVNKMFSLYDLKIGFSSNRLYPYKKLHNAINKLSEEFSNDEEE